MRGAIVTLALLTATAAGAQGSGGILPEVRPFIGAYVPTGIQRGVLADAVLLGAEAAVELGQSVHLLATFAYAPSRDRVLASESGLNVYQYDVGAEMFRTRIAAGGWLIRPFLGAGAGGRTYDLRDVAAGAQTYVSGYGAAGTEFQLHRAAVRLEGRDYISQFRGFVRERDLSTRNDVTLSLVFVYHLRK